MNTLLRVPIAAAAALILAACGRPETATPTIAVSSPPAPESTNTPTLTVTPIPRSAEIGEFFNTVDIRTGGDGDFAPAFLGQTLQIGGVARSGEDGRARLDLLPEGSVTRIGPNSTFVLQAISADPVQPATKLELLLGNLWIILKGGTLEVETANGLASVRGSYMSVSFDIYSSQTTITCLEGSCTLENEFGKVELTDGEMAFVTGDNPPEGPLPITQEEFDGWFENTLEAWELLDSTGYTPPAGLTTPAVCLICTPGYFLTPVPTVRTALPPTLPPNTEVPVLPTIPFPTP